MSGGFCKCAMVVLIALCLVPVAIYDVTEVSAAKTAGKSERAFANTSVTLSTLAMSGDGKYVVAGSPSNVIYTFLPQLIPPVIFASSSLAPVTDIAVSYDGSKAVTAEQDNKNSILTAGLGTQPPSVFNQSFLGSSSLPGRIALTRTGDAMLISVGNIIAKYNPVTYQNVTNLGFPMEVTCLATSDGGSRAALGTNESSYVWPTAGLETRSATNSGSRAVACAISASGDISVFGYVDTLKNKGGVVIYNSLMEAIHTCSTSAVQSLRMTRDGRLAVVTTKGITGAEVAVIDTQSGNETFRYTVGGISASADIAGDDGSSVVVATSEGKVFFYNVSTGALVWNWTNPNPGPASCAVISSNGEFCAAIVQGIGGDRIIVFDRNAPVQINNSLRITGAGFDNSTMLSGTPTPLRGTVLLPDNTSAIGARVNITINGTLGTIGILSSGSVLTGTGGSFEVKYLPPWLAEDRTLNITITADFGEYDRATYYIELTLLARPYILNTPKLDLMCSYTGIGNLSVNVIDREDIINYARVKAEMASIKSDVSILDLYADVKAEPGVTLNWINITMDYSKTKLPARVNEKSLKMYYADEQTRQWVLIENSGVDTGRKVLWANVTHLTTFSGGAKPTPTVGVAEGAFYAHPYFLPAMVVIIVGVPIGTILVLRKGKKPGQPFVPRGTPQSAGPAPSEPQSPLAPQAPYQPSAFPQPPAQPPTLQQQAPPPMAPAPFPAPAPEPAPVPLAPRAPPGPMPSPVPDPSQQYTPPSYQQMQQQGQQ